MSSTDHASQASQSAEAVASSLASKKHVYIDPEVVRKRRAEKAAKKAVEAQKAEQERSDNHDVATTSTAKDATTATELGFKVRTFTRLPGSSEQSQVDGQKRRKVKLMTWNMLAQALVRRTLFPGSDMLKWKDRADVLRQIVPHYDPDIACLQEVDKFDEFHKDNFSQAGYDTQYTTGYTTKLHGLCIAWKRNTFAKAGQQVIKLDDAEISKGRTGCSRATRNIGLLVALKMTDTPDATDGLIVVTHHLFWHARHQYERARQVVLLLREVHAFRDSNPEWKSWPCFFAGDFNIQPSEGTYRLMTGAGLSQQQEDNLRLSTVIHKSLDDYKRRQAEAALSETTCDDGRDDEQEDDDKTADGGEEYAQPEGDDDRVLVNTRAAREGDGLLSLQELQDLYVTLAQGAFSIYGQSYGKLEGEAGNFYGNRDEELNMGSSSTSEEGRIPEGYYEPAWTNITPLWRCTLDYIFVIPPIDEEARKSLNVRTTRLLPTHRLEDLEPGLPRKGKEPSDHVPIMAEVVW